MRKHKPAMASKHTRKPKMVAKAQRAKQNVVKSPKSSGPLSVTQSLPKSLLDRHDDSAQEVSLIQSPVATHDDIKQTTTANDLKKEFDFSSATANTETYQAKLLEMTRANMQTAFEFSLKFAMIRSPVEFLRVIEELTSRHIAMFRKS